MQLSVFHWRYCTPSEFCDDWTLDQWNEHLSPDSGYDVWIKDFRTSGSFEINPGTFGFGKSVRFGRLALGTFGYTLSLTNCGFDTSTQIINCQMFQTQYKYPGLIVQLAREVDHVFFCLTGKLNTFCVLTHQGYYFLIYESELFSRV